MRFIFYILALFLFAPIFAQTPGKGLKGVDEEIQHILYAEPQGRC